MLSIKELFGTDTIPDNLNFIYEKVAEISRYKSWFVQKTILTDQYPIGNRNIDVINSILELPEYNELLELGVKIDPTTFNVYEQFIRSLVEIDVNKFNIIDNLTFLSKEINVIYQYKVQMMMKLLGFDNLFDEYMNRSHYEIILQYATNIINKIDKNGASDIYEERLVKAIMDMDEYIDE